MLEMDKPRDPLLALETRTGLPDALRVLLEEYPREGWDGHRHFEGLVRFWMERHLMFREVMDRLNAAAEARLDDRIDGQTFGQQTARLGGFLLNQLHGHHMIEDQHYFPVLAQMETRLGAGFDLLDGDHHALDGHIQAMADGMNTTLRALGQGAARDETGRLHADLGRFAGFLNRHLIDEEELVVPVILKHGPARLG
jgi:iron-sulfur cluster repair protein YtfE (RIC family)